MRYTFGTLFTSSCLLATAPLAQSTEISDGFWSGGLKSGSYSSEQKISVELKSFNGIKDLTVKLDRWDGKFGTCVYLSPSREENFSLSPSRSHISENCPENLKLGTNSTAATEVEISLQPFVDAMSLYSVFPHPDSFPEPVAPEFAIDILGMKPGMTEKGALQILAEEGFEHVSQSFYGNGARIERFARGDSYIDQAKREAFPDNISLTLLESPAGVVVGGVYRAVVFPDSKEAADVYQTALLNKYGEEAKRGAHYSYDGKSSNGFRPCGATRIDVNSGIGQYTPSGGRMITGMIEDASCAYQVAYSLNDYQGIARAYSVSTKSPLPFYRDQYAKWAASESVKLQEAVEQLSSTVAPKL